MSIILDGTNGITSVSGSASLAVAGPTFSAYQSSAQTLSSSTWTKIQLQTKEWDTANAFDSTTNYRFQPQVAGYYQINTGIQVAAAQTNILTALYKNGSNLRYMQLMYYSQSGAYGSTLVYLNGSTDYIEFYVYLTTGQALAAGTTNTFMSGALIRSA